MRPYRMVQTGPKASRGGLPGGGVMVFFVSPILRVRAFEPAVYGRDDVPLLAAGPPWSDIGGAEA